MDQRSEFHYYKSRHLRVESTREFGKGKLKKVQTQKNRLGLIQLQERKPEH